MFKNAFVEQYVWLVFSASSESWTENYSYGYFIYVSFYGLIFIFDLIIYDFANRYKNLKKTRKDSDFFWIIDILYLIQYSNVDEQYPKNV